MDDPARSARAEVITALLRGAYDPEPGFTPALRLWDVWIAGRLDLMGTEVGAALMCEHCSIDEGPRFVEARTRTVRLVASRMPGFNGAWMRVEGLLYLGDSTIDGILRLDRATVVVGVGSQMLRPIGDGWSRRLEGACSVPCCRQPGGALAAPPPCDAGAC